MNIELLIISIHVATQICSAGLSIVLMGKLLLAHNARWTYLIATSLATALFVGMTFVPFPDGPHIDSLSIGSIFLHAFIALAIVSAIMLFVLSIIDKCAEKEAARTSE